MRSVLLPLPMVTSDTEILFTQSYTPRKLQLWTLNSGQQALITVLSSFLLNAHLLHTHPTQSGKHCTCLQTITHLGHGYQLHARPLVSLSHSWPIETEERKIISQFGFFGVPQSVLLCSSINVHFQDILLSPESGFALGRLISEAEGYSSIRAYPGKIWQTDKCFWPHRVPQKLASTVRMAQAGYSQTSLHSAY